MHVAWTLTDVSTGTPVVFSFPVNPNAFDPPNRKATITEQSSVAPNGGVVLFQGRDAVRSGQFSGVILTQQMYDDLNEWGSKWYSLTLTDDLGQSFVILITGVSFKRLNRHTHPHRYDYTIDYLVVG